MITLVDRSTLENMNASDFEHGDIIATKKYMIHILYKDDDHEYNTPYFISYVEDRKTHKTLGSTPGTPGGWPYYIADFLNR